MSDSDRFQDLPLGEDYERDPETGQVKHMFRWTDIDRITRAVYLDEPRHKADVMDMIESLTLLMGHTFQTLLPQSIVALRDNELVHLDAKLFSVIWKSIQFHYYSVPIGFRARIALALTVSGLRNMSKLIQEILNAVGTD